MKTLHIASIVTVLAVVCLSIGLVSALSSSDATIHATLSNPTPKAGDMVLVSVTFQSNVAQELKIYALGVHADWMEATQLYGPNLSSDPQTVGANGAYSTQFSLPIPSSASVGTHTFTIGVDGLDASGNAFSLDSAQSQVQVLGASSSTGPTSNPNGQISTADWLPYIAVAAAAVVVVVLVLVVMMRNRKGRKPAAPSSSEAPVSQEPESPQPDQKPDNQDFNI